MPSGYDYPFSSWPPYLLNALIPDDLFRNEEEEKEEWDRREEEKGEKEEQNHQNIERRTTT